MKLPRGITGYFDENTSFQIIDLKKFRSVCYDVSLQSNVTLLSIMEAEYPTNYVCAKFSLNEQPIQIIMNAYYPIFAASIIAEHGHIVFCELPSEFISFVDHYQLIDKNELRKAIDEDCVEQLSDVERHQIQLWSPRSIGETIFNAWD